ncbi:MAG: hypothetical protein K8J31_05400 [Anaerolineae bacterium]|nr:hypothetical protein [Anaerolineae bacterium]
MRYSDEQRQAALDCLAANEGDFQLASEETGVPAATLRKWARREQATGQELVQLQERLTALRQQVKAEPSASVRERMENELLDSMVDNALALAKTIQNDLDSAPLSQRATALNQVIDKILKLLAMLPPVGEQVIRIEFIDPDGSSHETPYWSRSHPGE